jgi:RNA polymerase sigma-70 factor (ECF subfamily)
MSPVTWQKSLESYRDELRVIAELDVDGGLQGKLDLSGVIQQTMLEAHQCLGNFRGSTEAELLSWLRRILANNLLDEIRRLQRVGYDARLDVSIHLSSRSLDRILHADHTPPEIRVEKNEQLLQLARAMLKLTQDQRYAVTRHHLQNATVATVAAEMGRTREAVAGLVHRGIIRLRDEMESTCNSSDRLKE